MRTLTALLVAAALVGPATASAAVRDCSGFMFPGGATGVFDFSVRNMGCSQAKRLILRTHRRGGEPSFAAARRAGFRCGSIPSDYEDGGTYRCHAGARAFRWKAGA